MPSERRRKTPKRRQLPELSRSELDLMKILWRTGPASVREVHDRLGPARRWAYSTTKTVMDRMTKKGLLARSDFHGVFLYEASVSRPLGLARLVRDFADRVLELDRASVVALFAHGKGITPEEVAELSRLVGEDGDDVEADAAEREG